MIVLMTEEPSMKAALHCLLRKQFPDSVEGIDWLIFDYQGKTDLERNIPDKLKRWHYGTPHFIILRDADGGDCKVIKQKLADLAAPSGKPFTVRIVCQDLESWFIGDPAAVHAAYPACSFSSATRKFRNPDLLTNASQILSELTGVHSKVTRASRISAHLTPANNGSGSFRVTFRALSHHLSEDSRS